MNTLLIFFAIPVATIILAAIFETFIRSPLKVAGIAFAIFLIVAFALGGTAELIVLAIIYTILAFIAAFLVCIFRNRDLDCLCHDRRSTNGVGLSSLQTNFNNNEFQDTGFRAQIGEATVQNNFENNTRTCSCRRCR